MDEVINLRSAILEQSARDRAYFQSLPKHQRRSLELQCRAALDRIKDQSHD